ncbi:MAG: type II secretion system F family protein [Candidatus Micrarchaeota archaeon]|nr:type II secretion system F family protein [Candidatus Micrarchaeota archaeon]
MKKTTIAAAAAASLAAAVLELHFIRPLSMSALLIAALTAFAPPACLYFFDEYNAAKKTREIEETLPAALFQVASFPKRTSMERIIRSLAKSDYGELSAEFAKTERLVNAGMSVPDALEELKKRNKTLLLDRAATLLIEAYNSGADMSKAFREVAEDVFDLQSVRKEAASAVALQKYTLLAGGCVLVPIILALVLNIVGALDFDEGLGFGAGAAERRELYATALWASQTYLVIFAAIASAFVATQEGQAKKAVIYFAFLAPITLLLFTAVRGINFFA